MIRYKETSSLCTIRYKENYRANHREILAGTCLFKINNRNIRTRCELCSKLPIKTPERRQWRRSGVFIVNFEHISHFALCFYCQL